MVLSARIAILALSAMISILALSARITNLALIARNDRNFGAKCKDCNPGVLCMISKPHR